MARILIIEDEPDIASFLDRGLAAAGHTPMVVGDGREGSAIARDAAIDLVLLDLGLPGLDGMSVLRQIRARGDELPVIILTARDELDATLAGFEGGANDYVTKPFSIRELLARVRALLRRVELGQPEEEVGELALGDLLIEVSKRKVRLGGEPVELTAKEFDLLALFAQHPGRAYSRQELLDKVWGYQYAGYSHTVNSHINRLRSKIEPDPANPRYVQTVWGVGYRFEKASP